MEEKKKKVFLIGMSIFLVLVLVIGGSYAWLTLSLNGTKTNVLKAGTLSLRLEDENSMGINQEKAVPMLDEVGEQTDPYHFTLINEGSEYVEYTIYFDDLELEENETRMADNKVKYNLIKDTRSKTALLSTLGENPNRVLDHGMIKGGGTITYDLRLWIDSEASNEVMGQVVRGKLRILATQVNATILNEENISMSIIGGNEIGFSEGGNVPLTDEEGVKLEPYHFSLKNTSGSESEYTVSLEESMLKTRSVNTPEDKIKYQLKKNDEVIAMSTLSNTIIKGEKVLDTGVIGAGDTNDYELRVWIDESVSEEEASNYLLQANLNIKTVQTEDRNPNILNIYQYDPKTCLTGEETTCIELKKAPEHYDTGTIIKYKVNDANVRYFHVMFDEGDTLTLQQRENILYGTKWYESGSGKTDNSKGPLSVLPSLENATAGWANVKDQTYTMGTTTFKTNAFTGCSHDSTTKEIICTTNKYPVLAQRKAKARMITAQEASALGCKYGVNRSCPLWMNNYLSDSKSYGGTVNGFDYGYGTMSAQSTDTSALYVCSEGNIYHNGTTSTYFGARAVVVIDK